MAIALIAAIGVFGCGDDLPRDRVVGDEWTPAEEDAGVVDSGAAGAGGGKASCVQVMASEALPAREVAMQGAASAGGRTVYASDLFATFAAPGVCAPCHTTDRGARQFTLTQSTFKDLPEGWFDRVNASDPADIMPPAGMNEDPIRYANRAPDDPFVQFVELLRQWDARGRPEVFTLEGQGAGDSSPYRFPKALGLGLTNIGNCIPTKSLVMPEENQDAARALDDRFAAVRSFTDLPRSLKDTDVFTYDAEALARHGVIAFAPAYTLWADNAKKIRFIRVPVGESVRFDVDTQSFDIPANTRFYKTFFTRVTDLEGNVRYRKMETRLILSRPDRVLDDGTLEHTAIFGTYKWNDEETEATLFTVPYRDRDPSSFQDDLRVYVADERIEDQVLRHPPSNLGAALIEAGAHRTYAMPGSDRCVHCHMGSKSFVLGFTPLQINRRPMGEGGVIEPAAAHELDQLQRLIDYGVITGLDSAEQVTTLEDSQLPRRARNEHELNAQGYILGNCAHCHNPRGYPSRREPILADTLDFLPSQRGGVFQFPLDKYSPRSFRGDSQSIRIPYISPSLYDHPLAIASNRDNALRLASKWIDTVNPTPAELAARDDLQSLPLRTLNAANVSDVSPLRFPSPLDPNTSAFDALAMGVGRPLLAPWRSFIYRNVDAPFSYEDGGTIFPRMPIDTPGYDCRVRRLMGAWMVSIPARQKPRPPLLEIPAGTRYINYPGLEHFDEIFGIEEQPYVEVLPGDAEYEQYATLADERLALFQSSERYHDCPESSLDAVAPEVASGQAVVPHVQVTEMLDDSGEVVESYDLLSPARHHYAQTDLRNDPSWVIRRKDWPSVLAIDLLDPAKAESSDPGVVLSSELTIDAVADLKVDEQAIDVLINRQRPMGLWVDKPACQSALAEVPRVSDFDGSDASHARPQWMDIADPPAAAPVYMASAGAQVFDMICSRCHGPQANGSSALATTIGDLSGGRTRVANLRDGLFGPATAPGTAWEMAFSDAAIQEFDQRTRGMGDPAWLPEPGVDARDRAARYIAWMGLGGTNAQIPPTVLTRLRSLSVLGEQPRGTLAFVPGPADAANMLTVAKLACQALLPLELPEAGFDVERGHQVHSSNDVAVSSLESRAGLIVRNGVAALWEDLCYFSNPAPVVEVDILGAGTPSARFIIPGFSYPADEPNERVRYAGSLYRRSVYPPNARVGDRNGVIRDSLDDSNVAPWCLARPPVDRATCATASASDGIACKKLDELTELALRRFPSMDVDAAYAALPWCPPELAVSGTTTHPSVADARRWAIRGAANAGLAVFLYLDALAKGQVQPNVAYDRCEELAR